LASLSFPVIRPIIFTGTLLFRFFVTWILATLIGLVSQLYSEKRRKEIVGCFQVYRAKRKERTRDLGRGSGV
jgi:hypothetical protein